jgi:hypothetical protein
VRRLRYGRRPSRVRLPVTARPALAALVAAGVIDSDAPPQTWLQARANF